MILHPEARVEFEDAALYYEREHAGLGDRFVSAVEFGFGQIQRGPFTWRCLRGDVRRFLVKTFPFGIVYACLDGKIYILAVMHLKREPDY